MRNNQEEEGMEEGMNETELLEIELKEMELHERRFNIHDDNEECTDILKVPGGWIYVLHNRPEESGAMYPATSTFVPDNN